MCDIINNAIERLSEREAAIIRAYFFEETKITDIATELHISKQRAAQIKDRGLDKMRNDPDVIQLYESVFG